MSAAPKSVFHLSGPEHWNTPEDLLSVVRLLGPIGLDPCSNKFSTVNAAVEYRIDKGENGLRRPWSGKGLVFVNPPFTWINPVRRAKQALIPLWTRKALEEAQQGAEIVFLVPARISSQWFHKYLRRAQRLCLWEGRLCFSFEGKIGNSPNFDAVIAYFGKQVDLFERAFSPFGLVFEPKAKAR
jgi:hypothetical protein